MIGIFDSGIGGLTVLRALWDVAPNRDVCYFGDTANIPYGTRSAEDLEQFTFRAMRLLRQEGATTLVSACHSVSASVIRPMLALFGASESSIIEMVGPVTAALARDHPGRVAIAMTEATARSRAYEEGFRAYGIVPDVIPCNDLAPAIEQGAPAFVITTIVDRVVSRAMAVGCDTLILGCTHFPFARERFTAAFVARDSVVRVVDPAAYVADAIVRATPDTGSGRGRFVLSRDAEVFRATVAREFSDHPCTIRVLPSSGRRRVRAPQRDVAVRSW